MKEIKNGDVYDIGQTINGVSTFLWFNDSIFYYSERMGHRDLEYEYDRNELTHLVEQDYDEQTTYLGNIFQNSKCINPINTIIEDDLFYCESELNSKLDKCDTQCMLCRSIEDDLHDKDE